MIDLRFVLLVVLLGLKSLTVFCRRTNPYQRVVDDYIKPIRPPFMRPVYNHSKATDVKFKLQITQLLDVSTTGEYFKLSAYFWLAWHTDYYQWNPLDYENVTSIRVIYQGVWTPEVVAYTSRAHPEDEKTHGWISHDIKNQIEIQSTGDVNYHAPMIITNTCDFHVQNFPSDEQVCLIEFGTWHDTIETIRFQRMDDKPLIIPEELENHVEWEVKNATLEFTNQYFQCCEQPFSIVSVTVTIRRKSLYYIFNYVLPILFLYVALLAGHLVTPDCGERVALEMTIMLTFGIMLEFISKSSLPVTSELSKITMFYFISLFIVFVSLLGTLISMTIFYAPVQLYIPQCVERLILPRHLWIETIQTGDNENDREKPYRLRNNSIQNQNEFAEAFSMYRLRRPQKKEQQSKLNIFLCKTLRHLRVMNDVYFDKVKDKQLATRSLRLSAVVDYVTTVVLLVGILTNVGITII